MNSGQVVFNYKECYFAKISCPLGACGCAVCLNYCFCVGSVITSSTALMYSTGNNGFKTFKNSFYDFFFWLLCCSSFKFLEICGNVFALLLIQKHNLKRSEEGPVSQKAYLFFPLRH